MLYGIFNGQASSGAVGYLSPPGGTALYTGANSWNREGRKNLAYASGYAKTSQSQNKKDSDE